MGAADRLRKLRSAVRAGVPARPGVYTWFGADAERIYVGKSRNLRARMLSYLVPGNLGYDARQRHLVSAIETFEYRETAGELMALLLEDALIKAFSPRHNERQKDYRERTYLLLTEDRFPTVLVVDDESGARPGTHFGPFKDVYFTRDLRALITDVFGLRACPDREPFRHSVRYDLGQCPGPCRGRVTTAEYAPSVDRLRAFLAGDREWVVGRLSEAMNEASEGLQFEHAASLRDSLEFCERFAARQRFFAQFETGTMSLAEADAGLQYEFSNGRLLYVSAADGRAVDVPTELRDPLEDRRVLLDRANVVYAWMRSGSASG